ALRWCPPRNQVPYLRSSVSFATPSLTFLGTRIISPTFRRINPRSRERQVAEVGWLRRVESSQQPRPKGRRGPLRGAGGALRDRHLVREEGPSGRHRSGADSEAAAGARSSHLAPAAGEDRGGLRPDPGRDSPLAVREPGQAPRDEGRRL